MQHYKMAVDLGADYILNTCSSVGEIASAARNILETPILKIDEPMAKLAVQNFQKIKDGVDFDMLVMQLWS